MPRNSFCLVAFAVSLACSSETPEVDRCVRMRDHVIDLRLASATNVDREAHRTAMRAALGDDFLTTCRSSLSESQVACVLKANDNNTAADCGRSAR